MNILSGRRNGSTWLFLIAFAVLALLYLAASGAFDRMTQNAIPQALATGTAEDHDAYLWTQINRAKNPGNLTDLEKVHVPGIFIEGPVKAGEPFNVTVRAGVEGMHPSLHSHFIEWVELYDGDLLLGHADLAPATTEPEVTFRVIMDKPGTLMSRINCNLHGTWENTTAVNVK
jgi:superoxide reductase